MLKQRIITSILLVPCLLALLFLAPVWLVGGVFFAVLLICGQEWQKLIPLQTLAAKIVFAVFYVLSLVMVYEYHHDWMVNIVWIWLPLMALVMVYPLASGIWANAPMLWILSILLTSLFAYALSGIYGMAAGQGLILYLFLLVWAADVGAYTFGKLWGRHKMIPKVSPGKSWEGFLGGLLFVIVVASVGAYYFQPISVGKWFLLAFDCFIVSVFGDLFISMLKRKCNLKDTGRILPGHGGALDRLDSLIAATPVFYAGLIWLGLGI